MAEFSSSTFPGDPPHREVEAAEWLPSLGGARLLRVRGRSLTDECPTLVLHAESHDHRVQTRFEPRFTRDPQWRGTYLVTPDLIAAGWTSAWLEWPDATQIPLPDISPSANAEVIDRTVLAEHRARRTATPAPDPSVRTSSATSLDAASPGTPGLGPEEREVAPTETSAAAREVARPETSAAEPAITTSGSELAVAEHDVEPPDTSAAARAVTSNPAVAGPEIASAQPAGARAAPPTPVAAAGEVPPTRGAAVGDPTSLETTAARDVDPSAVAARDAAGESAAPRGAAGRSEITGGPVDEVFRGETQWRVEQAALEGELSRSADALARARSAEHAARAAVVAALAGARADVRAVRAAREADANSLATLAADFETERVAHAVTRDSLGSLAAALAEARTALEAGRRELAHLRTNVDDVRAHLADARRDAAVARAEVASLRGDLEAERNARAEVEEALRAARESTERMRRLAELERQATGMHGEAELERRARAQTDAAAAATRRPADQTGRLLSDLETAAAALRNALPATTGDGLGDPAVTPVPPALARSSHEDHTRLADTTHDASARPEAADPSAEPAVTRFAFAARAVAAPEPPEPVTAADATPDLAFAASGPPSGPAVAPPAEPAVVATPAAAPLRPLRHAVVALAREDPVAAGEVLVGLLPAQGSVYADRVAYDLTIRGVGSFGVTVEGGQAHVQRLTRPRGRRRALFHLAADPLTLAELLAGEDRRIGRFSGPARVSRRRRRTQVLKRLSLAELSLADAVRAGARLEPALVYCALPFAIDPEWTRGHSFTVAQAITDASHRTWFLSALDGKGLAVSERRPAAPPDATVTMTRATFYRLLRGDPPADGDRPMVHGDRLAVAVLKTWTDRAGGLAE